MKKTYPIAIAVLAIILLLALAVFRGHGSRELILKSNGVPLANLRADVLPLRAGAAVVSTSTDANGSVDLSTVPAGTQMIAVTLWDGASPVYNGDILLPTRGSRTIDFRGNRTICTTKKTFADFGLFQLTGQEVVDSTSTVGPPKVEAEQPRPPEPAVGPVADGQPSPPAR